MSRRAPKNKKTTKSKPSPKPVEKEVRKEGGKKKPTHSYATYIRRLKTAFGDRVRLSSGVLSQMDQVMQVSAKTLSRAARAACIRNKKKTVTQSEVTLAINLHFPSSLAGETIVEVQKAIEKSNKAHKKTHSAPVRREVLADLVFPVSLTEKFLREFGASNLNVGKDAPIALTAALEWIARKILDVSVEQSKANKKATVNPRHMFLAISNSDDLSALIKNFNIEFMGVGVIPHIREELVPDKRKKNTQTARRRKARVGDSGKKGSHKFLPGTVALREIRRYQKSTELLLQKLPFERMLREISAGMSKNVIHFGSGSLISIQYFVEQKVIDVMQTAVDLAIHAGREGVKQSDAQLAWKLSHSWVPETTVEAALDDTADDEGEPKKPKGVNGMVRLARRAGAKRIGKEAFPVIRQFIYSLVTIVLNHTIQILKYRKVITVGNSDLENTFSTLGINFAILRPVGKHRSAKKAIET